MMLRLVGTLLAALLLCVPAPANVTPETQAAAETLVIGFDPPLEGSARYRWETSEQKEGKLEMSWSIDDYSFEETEGGYRLVVTPVSYGSNEEDPTMLALEKKLAELSKLPFVLRLNEDAEIVELERADEFWSKIKAALREVFSDMKAKQPEQEKAIEAIIGVYDDLPAETRLAKLTEPIQPLVEFAWTEMSIGKPILVSMETPSPFGPVKREVAITLTRVSDGFAHLTLRSSIPTAEMKKLTSALIDRFSNGAVKPEELAKAKTEIAAAEQFNHETVADYKVSVDDGMLESFHSTQTVSATERGKLERTVKTFSVKRIH